MPGDVYKPRRPGDAGHRPIGAGRGDSAGLGQVSPTIAFNLTFTLFSSKIREIVGHKRIVQNNKQLLSSLRRKARDRDLAPYRVLPDPASRINARWTNEELLLAVQVSQFFLLIYNFLKLELLQGIRKFGKNFSAIASILGTKTESHVRSFFVNYRRRYDLDLAYKV